MRETRNAMPAQKLTLMPAMVASPITAFQFTRDRLRAADTSESNSSQDRQNCMSRRLSGWALQGLWTEILTLVPLVLVWGDSCDNR